MSGVSTSTSTPASQHSLRTPEQSDKLQPSDQKTSKKKKLHERSFDFLKQRHVTTCDALASSSEHRSIKLRAQHEQMLRSFRSASQHQTTSSEYRDKPKLSDQKMSIKEKATRKKL